MPVTALLATASGLQGPWAWMARLIQALLTASLISIALAWMARVTARRRQRARGAPPRLLLAYPLWMAGLGLGCILLFSLCAWFAWQSPPARGGPRAAKAYGWRPAMDAALNWLSCWMASECSATPCCCGCRQDCEWIPMPPCWC